MATSGGTASPAQADSADQTNVTAPIVDAHLYGVRSGSAWNRIGVAGFLGDGSSGDNMMATTAFLYQPSDASYARQRNVNVFKTQSFNTAGAGTVWTPTAGKKFRLMRFQLMFTDDASLAVAATQTYELRDSGTGVGIRYDVFLPGAAGTALGSFETPWVDLGNGILSAAANNVLQLNIPTNLAAGVIRINVAGTEE